ncbi:hypothetical protein CLOM_g15928, partial [Closterium sp. NIES-68]
LHHQQQWHQQQRHWVGGVAIVGERGVVDAPGCSKHGRGYGDGAVGLQALRPIMATGWHMVLGGVPLPPLVPAARSSGLWPPSDLSLLDWSSLVYTSVFGSAISYGVFFYNANKGNLTRLSSLTFLTPAFAAFFGFVFLGETLSPLQFFGAGVTLVAIYLVNARSQQTT